LKTFHRFSNLKIRWNLDQPISITWQYLIILFEALRAPNYTPSHIFWITHRWLFWNFCFNFIYLCILCENCNCIILFVYICDVRQNWKTCVTILRWTLPRKIVLLRFQSSTFNHWRSMPNAKSTTKVLYDRWHRQSNHQRWLIWALLSFSKFLEFLKFQNNSWNYIIVPEIPQNSLRFVKISKKFLKLLKNFKFFFFLIPEIPRFKFLKFKNKFSNS
jgi:hypothetical protein